MSNIIFVTAHELATRIRHRQVSATEVLEAHLARIAQYNPPLNAIITLEEERARTRAKEADTALFGGRHSIYLSIQPDRPPCGGAAIDAFSRRVADWSSGDWAALG